MPLGITNQNAGVLDQIRTDDEKLVQKLALEAEARQDPGSPREIGAQVAEADDEQWQREREQRERDQAKQGAT